MFYPNIEIDGITNPGEHMVAEALVAQCPKEWIIIYSKYWLWHDTRYNKNRFKEGEIDFIVIVPNKGFVCFEVKSAKQYRLTKEGRWQRYDESLRDWVTYTKTPLEQVTTNKHALVQILQQKCGDKSLHCAYGAAVLFPRAKMYGSLPAGEDNPTVIIEASGLEYLAQTIRDILDRWWEGVGKTDSIERFLCPKGAQFYNSLALCIQYQNSKLIRLTNQQFRILQGLRENKIIQVLGGAGTGKTLLGLELAKESIHENQRVLFLCFSRQLAVWIASNFKEERFLAINFHRLARQYISAASIKWPDNPDDNFWKDEINKLFLDAMYTLGQKVKFDTVIVDEMQDFLGEWLILARELWNGSGKLIFFGDENQTLFGGQLFGHKQIVKYILQYNCRNTLPIATLCNNILKTCGAIVDPKAIENLPFGNVPRLSNYGNSIERKSEAISQVHEWMKEGLSLSQIVVLSPWQENNSLEMNLEDKTIDGIPFTRNLETWRQEKACLFETIRSFKGLEADAVVLVDATDINAGFSLEDAYVACSRPKNELLIVPTTMEAYNLFSHWLR